MDGVNGPSRAPQTLLTFHSPEDINQFALGCDKDIGGTSSAKLDFVPDEGNSGTSANVKGKGRFWGEMRLGVRSDLQGRIRGGYAGFRSKVRVI